MYQNCPKKTRFLYHLHKDMELFFSRQSVISFMYNKNNDGPSIAPCGIPHTISLDDDV